MNNNNISEKLKRILPVIVILSLSGLVSCVSEHYSSDVESSGGIIEFGASLGSLDKIKTRTLDTLYVGDHYSNLDFYIEMNTTDDTGNPYTEIGTYVVPPGYEGRLNSKIEDNRLHWQNLSIPHTFYSWTLPWLPADYYGINNSQTPAEPIEIEFHNSGQGEGFDEYANDAVYERFIGTVSDTYNYKEHGKYVELVFKHLVSKIVVDKFTLIKPDGSFQNDLKADITFFGMPSKAIFTPHPDQGGPIVEADMTSVPAEGLTYFIENFTATDSIFICPELDFSNMSFKIKLDNEEYGSYGDYYGTFNDLEFVRNPGTDYDQGNDSKVLHAGEYMTMNITLVPGVGPGISILIEDWSTEEVNEAIHHTHPGIFTDQEVLDLLDIFWNQRSYQLTPEQIDMLQKLMETYGGETIDGENIFYLFSDVNISGQGNGNIFPVPPGYVIYGNSNTIIMKTNTGVFPDRHPYYNIGPMRDVYLSDNNGNNSIYIDADGYVWIYNSETYQFEKTENQLTELGPGYKGYDIDSVTGEVRQTTYYNNQVTN